MITNQLNPLVVQTELDDLFAQRYNMPAGPMVATALSPEVFNQVPMENAAHIEAVLGGGGGIWPDKTEQQNVPQVSPRIGDKVTYTALTFANGVEISKEYFDDNMHGAYQKMIKDFANGAIARRETSAFGIFRGAFTTTLTADGATFVSASHTTLTGLTVSNRLAGNPSLTVASLKDAITALMQQVSQAGIIMMQQPKTLLVPSALFYTALEIVGSGLQSGTGNNNLNVFPTAYGIEVKQSPYLGTSVTGGSNTAWFLMSDNHAVSRYFRESITTYLNDWRLSQNQAYWYAGRFREIYGVTDYVGVVGSDGTNVA